MSLTAPYIPADGLWAVTCYFNADRYRTKLVNYLTFAHALESSGIPLLTIESAFGDDEFELPDVPGVLRIRARDVLWQKERLLNLAERHLPSSCRYVAWLDADVLFENPRWAVETARALEARPVVQPYGTAVRLPRGHFRYEGSGETYESFGAVYARSPQELLRGRFDRHGHTGFAWAIRRDVLGAHGLYDACIAGSGDHMMAHAFCGDFESDCVRRILCRNAPYERHFRDWCRRMYRDVRARVGFVEGRVLHLWHGDVIHRRYVDRNKELATFGYDPSVDVRVDPRGCWEWASAKPELHAWARSYFAHRKEDGILPEELVYEREWLDQVPRLQNREASRPPSSRFESDAPVEERRHP